MADQTPPSDAELIAELNDLLQLDHDALRSYDLAISALQDAEHVAAVTRFRDDHERHISELSILVRGLGGTPVESAHMPTGPMKLGVQAIGAAAAKAGSGDMAVLLAFKANERQGREKYRRAAQRNHPGDVTSVLARAADDEARHYAWVLETLDGMGAHPGGTTMRAEKALELANVGMADAIETAGRAAMRVVGGPGSLGRRVRENPLGSALVALGLGLVGGSLTRDR